MNCKYLVSLCDLPFHSLIGIFRRAEILNFNELQLIFHFMISAFFVSFLRSLCLPQGPDNILLFCLGSFNVVPFAFGSTVHLSLVFCVWCEVGVNVSDSLLWPVSLDVFTLGSP